MSVKYKPIGRGEPGVKGGGKTQYYASVVSREVRDIDKLSQAISSISTVSGADVRAVLYALVESTISFLTDGDIVQLGDLGTLRLSLSSTGEATPEDVDVSSIKSAHILFRPGAMFANMLKTLQFEKEKQPEAAPNPVTLKKKSSRK